MITSREPITYLAREALTFADMKITRFSAKLESGITRVVAVLQNFNEVTEKFDPELHTFSVHLDDLVAASQTIPRIAKILTELDEVVQLLYNVQFIQHKFDQAITDEQDTTQLGIDLREAQDALSADPGIARA